MNRARALCAMDRFMMEAFSERTVAGLSQHTLFRLALPPFRSFLDINVGKEVEKDKRVITRAAALQAAGTTPAAEHIDALLREARDIDENFVRRSLAFPIDIKIRYEDIEHYRQQRITLLLRAAHNMLGQWQPGMPFRKMITEMYSEATFAEWLRQVLQLYAQETRSLSRSIRLPGPLSLARDALTQTITDVMEREAASLSRSLSQMVYRNKA